MNNKNDTNKTGGADAMSADEVLAVLKNAGQFIGRETWNESLPRDLQRVGKSVAALIARNAELEAELTQLCNTVEGCGLGDLPPELEAGVCFARGLLDRAEARNG